MYRDKQPKEKGQDKTKTGRGSKKMQEKGNRRKRSYRIKRLDQPGGVYRKKGQREERHWKGFSTTPLNPSRT